MKRQSKLIITFPVVFFVLLTNCTGYHKADNSKLEKVPTAFVLQNDSTTSADVGWRDFFKDSVLVNLIEQGLNRNLDILTAFQRIEFSKAEMTFSHKALLPSLSVNASAARRKYGLYTMDGAGNISTEIEPGYIVPINLPDYYVGFQSSWEADIWGKLKNKKKSAIARYLATVEGKNFLTTNLVAEIALNYYDLLAMDNQLEILRETIKLQDEALQIAEVQKRAGVTNELAVEQFEAQLLSSKALELEVEQSITERESKLNHLLGRYPQSITRKGLEFMREAPYVIKVGVPADLLRNRPDVRRAEYELMASGADVKSARKAFYPSVTITGAVGYQAYKMAFLFSSPESVAYALVGGLAAPILNRKELKRELGKSMALNQMAVYAYQNALITGFTEVHNEMIRINRLEKILEYKLKEADVMSLSIETSSELFKTGRANYMEVLMAQRNSLRSKLEMVSTKQKQFNSFINIYKALGGGWK
ncbi:MAG: efflux transporter outer membrane subunit [Bacteroidia bacterium]|nr:efflux transporter outer membrane subunit [Bacteroidia bacterium]